MKLFNYSGRYLISIKDATKLRKEQISKVKSQTSTGDKNIWIDTQRVPNTLYKDDSLQELDGIADAKEKLFKNVGINNMGDLKVLSEDDLKLMVANPDFKISLRMLREYHHYSQVCLDVNAPPIIDHRKADNPYLSKYGEKTYEAELDEKALGTRMCITNMIIHLYEHTKALYTQGGDTRMWWFYHDSLSLMTAKETVKWMKEKNIYKHWVLPELGIVDSFEECKTWKNMLPGNTPASNPLDMQCFSDVKFRLDSWIRLTESYDDEDPRKYTLITPKAGFDSINRVWQTTPSSKRLCEDIHEIPNSYKIIIGGGGILCDRDSNISAGRGHKKGGWGGKREKGVHEGKDRTIKVIPPEAMDAVKQLQRNA